MLPESLSFSHVRAWSRAGIRCAVAVALILASVGCEPLLLSPPQYGDVQVSVTTGAGVPLPGVLVNLYTGQRPIEYAQTDAAGAYTFTNVPPGNYGLVATVPDSLANIGDPFAYRDNLVVSPGARLTAAFTFARCTGSVVVSVLEATGVPAAGVPVTLYSTVGVVESLPTATDGLRRFSAIRCGEYGVRLGENAGYALTEGRGSSFIDGARLTPANPDLALSFRVNRCRASIRVLARDAAGTGVQGASVTVRTSLAELAKGVTSTDGSLILSSIPCGMELSVEIVPPSGYSVPPGRGTSLFDGIRLTDGSSTDIVFRLNRP